MSMSESMSEKKIGVVGDKSGKQEGVVLPNYRDLPNPTISPSQVTLIEGFLNNRISFPDFLRQINETEGRDPNLDLPRRGIDYS